MKGLVQDYNTFSTYPLNYLVIANWYIIKVTNKCYLSEGVNYGKKKR